MKKLKLFLLLITAALVLFTACALGETSTAMENARSTYVQTEGILIPVIDDLKRFDIPDNEAMRFTRELKTGWNLGNTFDAYDNSPAGYQAGLKLESSWTGAKTQQALFTALKEAGFNLIRIPVSWHNHLIDDEYTIDPVWMNRVKEVAGWAVEEGLYIIINVHHDNQVGYLYPDTEHYESSAAYMSAVWKQMAEAFADFDEHCILESMNEPRLVGTKYEWNYSAAVPHCKDSAECINKLNQLFVDTVRATGGNNATRYLAVPGYDASPEGALSIEFRLPKDTVPDRMIVSVHAYRPYEFALKDSSNDRTFDLEKEQNKKQDIAVFMNQLYNRYIVKGIPVLIDEYGATDRNGNLQARVNFAAYYTASASSRGITCCWWDNHAFQGNKECFGLINRNLMKWKYPDIAMAINANCLYNREN